jgi:hypothetical protein
MKTKILLLFLLGWVGMVFGQDLTNLNKALDSLVKKDLKYVSGDRSPLVSAYTFTQMVKRDFATLVTGSADNNQVGKYAALSIDKTEQSFSFSPITYVFNGDDGTKSFKHVVGINASGKLNSDGFFDFSNRKKFRIGGSWTWLLVSSYNYNPTKTKYVTIYEEAKDITKLAAEKKVKKYKDLKIDTADYKELYHQEVEKTENEVYKSYWTSKLIVWTKLDIGYAEDRLKIIDSAYVKSSIIDPIKENINGGYGSLSINFFRGLQNGFSFYFNTQISYLKKTSLSEAFSTAEWNKIQYAADTNHTVYYNLEKDNVYITSLNTFEKRYKVDLSFQLLSFFPLWQKNLIGLDLSYQRNAFVTPGTKTFTSTKNIFSIGIMFPLKDKDGNTTINIEPFWQTISYNNYDLGENESFLGIKFGVPLNQLF